MLEQKIKVRVRLIIIRNGKILLSYQDAGFYYYIGGKVEFGETLKEACIREVKEESDANFTFGKILFIRDFIQPEQNEHSVEFFILGSIDKFSGIHGKNDELSTVKTHLEWVDLDDLKKIDIKPSTLTGSILAGFKSNFVEGTEYIEKIS